MNTHQTPASLYLQGKAEIESMGTPVTKSSWFDNAMVCVTSIESVPNTYGHPRHEFVATRLDGQWIIQRSYELRQAYI
jgi:hypothetical protein